MYRILGVAHITQDTSKTFGSFFDIGQVLLFLASEYGENQELDTKPWTAHKMNF